MEILVQSTVFNKELVGKAVFIEGYDVDGDKWDEFYLVNSVEVENLILVNLLGRKSSLHMENFEGEHGMKLTVLTEGVKN
ncbi:hypothetical protein P4V88_25475 [Bacillus thuringiensis]|uniref:hypothetical protein n=1 Tax=Bacillus thuringiensis TaxID=1428 RepID=UPI000A36AF5A|nr:hypothetical protein [Bacillus thuringiensis]MED2126597.1 hypothetical protein [Bacillus thuringiensis]MED2150374.1 hypothetical protein [Bacillus thuringiensis]MED2175257.1 hypothetical protein [Bacillus thuringiensis]MED2578104.1 hypothetical protein [Bacillus thuringiensis]MED3506154.1 hypothetical protein [Bacillus thuringiensis]